MTYNYVTTQESRLYHIVKVGRIYALCGLSVQKGKKIISPEPPAGKKECHMCARMVRGTADKANTSKS